MIPTGEFDDGRDRFNSWINFSCCGKETGGPDDYVMQSYQNSIDRLGLVEAEIERDQEPSTPELGMWRASGIDDSGTASGISRSRLNDIQDWSWT